jgi:hypothetical protein
MAGNPRDHVKGKGFWDGGSDAQSANDQSSGRPSGFPGRRLPKRVGLRTDIEFPSSQSAEAESTTPTRKP